MASKTYQHRKKEDLLRNMKYRDINPDQEALQPQISADWKCIKGICLSYFELFPGSLPIATDTKEFFK